MGCRPLWVLAFAALWSGCAGHCGPAPDRAHGPCAHAKPGRGQFAFVATTHPPALRFESVCDARLPLQAGPFRYDARRGLLTGRVRLTNRGRASTPPLLAYVDFLSDDRGDWRFRSQVSTLDSLVTANGRRGFLYGRLGRGQSRWARWSFWVPEGRRRVLRGSGWVGAAHRTGLWVELEELAGGTREGRYDARGWAWLHRADGFSGWGELGTGKRRAPHAVRQKLRVPFSGPVRADVRVRPMGKRGAVRARVGSLTGSVGDGGFGGHRMEHLGDGRISRHPSLVLSDSVRGYSRLDALRLWPLSSGAPPDAVPERVISSRTAPQELPRELRRRLAHQPRPPGVGQGTDALAKWRRRVPGLRARLARLLDLPTPEASPPAVRHLGVSYRGPLRVERLHIEGRPGIWASALVYRLQRTRSGAPIRRPAVLHVVGHYGPGKRWKPIRIFDANLARQGYVVLVVDQLSLGERRTGPENHHFLGMLSWLVGSNAARTLYGEVPRFLDYLERRPDVDPARIGMVGSSGGGTATLLTAARDERVRAAAALASVTRWEHLFTIIGGDPEQYAYDMVRQADFPTLIRMVAPRPLLVGVGRRDGLFPPGPARAAVRAARDAYRAYGAVTHLVFAEDGMPHGLPAPRRLSTYRFFARFLAGRNAAAIRRLREHPELAVGAADPALFTGTPEDVRSLVDEARERGRDCPRELGPPRDAAQAVALQRRRRAALAERLRWSPVDPPAPRWVGVGGADGPLHPGRFQAAGLDVPATWITPPAGRGPVAVLYVTDAGRASAVHAVALAEAGATVLAPDLAGRGEMRPSRRYRYALSSRPGRLYREDFHGLALLLTLGDSLCGLRLAQIREAVALLRRRTGRRVAVVGQGTESGVYALLAAALDPTVVAAAALDPLRSLRDPLDAGRFPPSGLVAQGLLRVADTDEMAALIAPRPLLVVGGRDAYGRPLLPVPGRHFRHARQFFRQLGVPGRLAVRRRVRSRTAALIRWYRQVVAWAGARSPRRP